MSPLDSSGLWLAVWLSAPLPLSPTHPCNVPPLGAQTATDVVFGKYPSYGRIARDDISVRVKAMPILDSLRDLRHLHLNAMVRVEGVVTRRSQVYPQLKKVRYACSRCGSSTGLYTETQEGASKPSSCPSCDAKGALSLDLQSTIYSNFQRIFLQEAPGSVPPGRVPRSKEVILRGDLIDCARPGEIVEITGVYLHQYDPMLNTRQGFPVFATLVEANYVEARTDALAAMTVTAEDRDAILELSRHPKILTRIIRSIAPSIYGHEHVKLALALAMFGGREINVNEKHRVRGDINVLLLGDPGVAKSQFLKVRSGAGGRRKAVLCRSFGDDFSLVSCSYQRPLLPLCATE